MWQKFLWYWIKGSSIIVIILTLELMFGVDVNPFVHTGYIFLDWILSYLILLTPLGAVFGYLMLWIFLFLLDLLLSVIGMERGTVTKYVTKVPNVNMHKDTIKSLNKCPFAGTVLSDKEKEVFGFKWPYKAEILIIHKNWHVTTPNNLTFGWIDVDGVIHKDKLIVRVHPKAILSGGNTGLKVLGSEIYKGNEKVGDLVKNF